MDIEERDTKVQAAPAPCHGAVPAAPPPSRLTSWLVAALLVAAVAVLRFGVLSGRVLPVAYGVPLVACVAFRRRSILWAMVATFSAMSLLKFGWTWKGDS